MSVPVRPRVAISRCLLGDQVRYDGGHKHEPTVVEAIGAEVEWIPICPEVEAGMGVPREPVHLTVAAPDAAVRLVGVDSGEDWTSRLEAVARGRLDQLRALDVAGIVLKSRSPSCGLREVPVRGGHSGAGMFAALVQAAMPDLPTEDEQHLREPSRRARFMDRVRARHLRILSAGTGRTNTCS